MSRQLPVLGADTAVVVDGEMLGKPRDRADALAMLARLSGRSTGALGGGTGARGTAYARALSRSVVRFRALTRARVRGLLGQRRAA